MIRTLFYSFGIIFAANFVSAQSLPVRSGEHGDFTRLTVPVTGIENWRLNSAGTLLRLSIEGSPIFRLENVFQRITRERIDDVTTDTQTGDLLIELACQCSSNSFVTSGGLLVIDIADAEATTEPTGNERSPNQPTTSITKVTEWLGTPQVAFSQPRLDEDMYFERETNPEKNESSIAPNYTQTNIRTMAGLEPVLPELMANAPAGQTLNLPDLSSLETVIRRSADEGVLTAADAPLHNVPENDQVIPEDKLPAPIASLRTEDTDDGLQVSMDSCIPDERLIRTGSPVPTLSDVISMRSGLYREFDEIEDQSFSHYVQSLLVLGFGAEARSLMKLKPSKSDVVSTALSYLVDGEADPKNLFRNQIECEGQAAIWALLSQPEEQRLLNVDTDTILEQTIALPRTLRSHLGSKVAMALHETGNSGAAEDLLSRLDRTRSTAENEIVIARANIALDQGDFDSAASTLDSMVLEESTHRPALVLARIDTAFGDGRAVAADTLSIAELIYQGRKDLAQGDLFWRGYIRALLTTYAFDEAATVFKNPPQNLRSDVYEATRRDLATRLVHEASDVTFLKLLFADPKIGADSNNPAVVRAFAERLLRLGLPQRALDQLSVIEQRPVVDGLVRRTPISEPENLQIRARALAELGQLDAAEAALAGLMDRDAISLRAELQAQRGAYSAARAEFVKVSEGDKADRAAWLDGAWNIVSQRDDIFGAAAGLAEKTPASIQTGDRSDFGLSQLETMVSESVSARETLSTLLRETEINESP